MSATDVAQVDLSHAAFRSLVAASHIAATFAARARPLQALLTGHGGGCDGGGGGSGSGGGSEALQAASPSDAARASDGDTAPSIQREVSVERDQICFRPWAVRNQTELPLTFLAPGETVARRVAPGAKVSFGEPLHQHGASDEVQVAAHRANCCAMHHDHSPCTPMRL